MFNVLSADSKLRSFMLNKYSSLQVTEVQNTGLNSYWITKPVGKY